MSGFATSEMLALVVRLEIKPDRVEEFERVIEEDAVATRAKEPGNIRFDVVRSKENPMVFLYEVYANQEAFDEHQRTEHFKLWQTFYDSGGVADLKVDITTGFCIEGKR